MIIRVFLSIVLFMTYSIGFSQVFKKLDEIESIKEEVWKVVEEIKLGQKMTLMDI